MAFGYQIMNSITDDSGNGNHFKDENFAVVTPVKFGVTIAYPDTGMGGYPYNIAASF